MTCARSATCDNRAHARKVYCRVGLSEAVNLGTLRLCEKTKASSNGVILTLTSFLSQRFYTAFVLRAWAVETMTCSTCWTLIYSVIGTVAESFLLSYSFGSTGYGVFSVFSDLPGASQNNLLGSSSISFFQPSLSQRKAASSDARG